MVLKWISGRLGESFVWRWAWKGKSRNHVVFHYPSSHLSTPIVSCDPPIILMHLASVIFMDMVVGRPMFSASDELGQLDSLFDLVGDFETAWPAVTALPWYNFVRPREKHASKLADTCKE